MSFLHLILLVQLIIPTADPCNIPASYANYASRTEGDIKYTFAMDRPTYVLGSDLLYFHYIVENLGTGPVTFIIGQTPMRAFVIYPDTCLSLDQLGCLDAAVQFDPTMVFYGGGLFTLNPGECKVFSRSWNQGPECMDCELRTGSFHVFGGLWEVMPVGWPGHWFGPSDLMLNIEIVDTPTGISETETTTWGAIKSIYRK